MVAALWSLKMLSVMAVTGSTLVAGAGRSAPRIEVPKKVATQVMVSLAEVATAEVKKTGIFTIPGLCRIKTRMKPATKAGKKEVFGKMCIVKAKPARKIVKAFPVAALKASI